MKKNEFYSGEPIGPWEMFPKSEIRNLLRYAPDMEPILLPKNEVKVGGILFGCCVYEDVELSEEAISAIERIAFYLGLVKAKPYHEDLFKAAIPKTKLADGCIKPGWWGRIPDSELPHYRPFDGASIAGVDIEELSEPCASEPPYIPGSADTCLYAAGRPAVPLSGKIEWTDPDQYVAVMVTEPAAYEYLESQHIQKNKNVPHGGGESDTPLSRTERDRGNTYLKIMDANNLKYITGGEGQKIPSWEEKNKNCCKDIQGKYRNKNPQKPLLEEENIPISKPGKHVTWAGNPGFHVYLQQEKEQKIPPGIPTTFNIKKSKKSIEGERKKIPLPAEIPAGLQGNNCVELR